MTGSVAGTPAGGPPGRLVAAALRAARRAAGLTQEQLAQRCGLAVRTIRNLEQGQVARPQQRTVLVLADGLGLQGPDRKRFLRLARAATPAATPVGEAAGAAPGPPGTAAGAAAVRGELARPAAPAGRRSRPQELPVNVTDVTGREAELSRLRRHADAAAAGERTGVTVVSVSGEPGVGKTTLAVAAGHQLADLFPDGQLFVPLGGTAGVPRSSLDALGAVLRSIGVPDGQLPSRADERAGLYRTLLRNQRMLVVLDDAASEEQVRPLLAGGPACLVLVTSRRALAGLTPVDRLRLGDLPGAAAVGLLAAITGPERIAAEPAAAGELVAACGALPLALRIAGNRLASRPHWTVSDLVGRIRGRQRRLSALTAGDLGVRAAFDVSYRQLGPPVRQVFRVAALVPGRDFAVPLVAVLTGGDEVAAEDALEELTDAGLAQSLAAGRYQYHDLIRDFADERLHAEHAEADRRTAEVRMLRWLLGHAGAAGASFDPDNPVGPDPQLPGGLTAAAFLEAEAANWTAAFGRGVELGLHAEVVAAARAMHWYSDILTHRHPWAELFRLGVDAAVALGSRSDEAALLNFHGWALSMTDTTEDSELAVHTRAHEIAREIGDRREEAWSLLYLAVLDNRRGRVEAAVDRSRAALALFEEVGFAVGMNVAVTQLGQALAGTGRYAEALAMHEHALEQHASWAVRWPPTFVRTVTATTLAALGADLMGLGRPAEAAAAYRRAQVEFDRNGGAFGAAFALYQQGRAWFAGRDPDRARSALEAAADRFAAVPSPWWQARTLHELTGLPGQSTPQLRRLLTEALALCTPLDSPDARQLHTVLRTRLAELAVEPAPHRP